MPKKKIEEAPKETPKETIPLDKIGLRTVKYQELTKVQVGTTDLGRAVEVDRAVEKERQEVRPDITLEEAKAVEAASGPLEWKPFGDGFTCGWGEGANRRRLIITAETMKALRE